MVVLSTRQKNEAAGVAAFLGKRKRPDVEWDRMYVQESFNCLLPLTLFSSGTAELLNQLYKSLEKDCIFG